MGTLLNRRRYMGGVKGLPYDAEVAYLESTGTQWIDTGISPTTNTEVTITLRFNSYVQNSILCGARTGTTSNQRFFPFAHTSEGVARFTYGTTQYTNNIVYNGSVYTVKFNETSTHKCYINGTDLGTLSGYSKSTDDTLLLFGTSGYGSEHYLCKGNIYRCTIKENGVTVRDFIPVRVGQVGYMYDRTSGTLFGNQGTGAFVLGGDIVPIEYLESSGTQYIYVPLSVSSGTYFEVSGEFIPLHSNNNNSFVFSANPYQQFEAGYYSYNSSTGIVTYASTVGNSAPYGGWGAVLGVKSAFLLSTAGKIDISGTYVELSRPLTANITAFRIFGSYRNNDRYPIAFCSFKIVAGTTTLYDLIPVRAGQVGYMYDKISHTIFANAGTGSFTIGPDKT